MSAAAPAVAFFLFMVAVYVMARRVERMHQPRPAPGGAPMSAPPPTAVCPHCGRVVDLYHDDGLLLLTCHDLPDTYRVCPASATAAPGESR